MRRNERRNERSQGEKREGKKEMCKEEKGMKAKFQEDQENREKGKQARREE